MAELQNDPSPGLTLKAYEADRLNVKYFHNLHKSWIFVTLGHANQNRVFAKALSGLNDTRGSKGLRPVFGVSEYRPETKEDIVFDLLSWRPRGLILTGLEHTDAVRQTAAGGMMMMAAG